MRVLNTIYVNARFLSQPLTGVQRYAFECCMQMKNENPAIIFLSPRNIRQHSWAEQLGVKKIGWSKGHLWEQIDLSLYLLNQMNYILFNPCNTAPLALSNNIITIHDISYLIYKENNSFLFQTWYNYLMPRIAKRAQHIFTVSHFVQKQLCSTYLLNNTKVSVTYNGIASEFLNDSQYPKHAKKKIILTVGSISKRKNLEILISAFLDSSLKDQYQLVIAGSNHTVFSHLSLEKSQQVKVIENLTDTELRTYYQQAEIFVSLSNYEGFGIPVLEAIFYGCKVLCADIETYRELFKEYVYFCNHHDKEKIIEALTMIAVTNSPIEANIDNLISTFSYVQSAQHILGIITNLSTI